MADSGKFDEASQQVEFDDQRESKNDQGPRRSVHRSQDIRQTMTYKVVLASLMRHLENR